MRMCIPYFKGYKYLEVSEDRLNAVLLSKVNEFQTEMSQEEIVRKALNEPVGTISFRETVKNKKRILI